MASAKLSLAEAADTAIAADGGQPVAARLTVKHGAPVYKMALMRGGLQSKVKVDAQTGAVLGIEHEEPGGFEHRLRQRALG